METSLKKSCLGSLYLANSDTIQNSCKFKIAEASKQIFELAENTWVVYSTGTINTNQVSDQEFDPDPSDQLRRHHHSGTSMLHPDCESRDLSGRIGNN